MTDPKEQQAKKDELELEAEKVEDLEPDEKSAEAVKGGPFVSRIARLC